MKKIFLLPIILFASYSHAMESGDEFCENPYTISEPIEEPIEHAFRSPETDKLNSPGLDQKVQEPQFLQYEADRMLTNQVTGLPEPFMAQSIECCSPQGQTSSAAISLAMLAQMQQMLKKRPLKLFPDMLHIYMKKTTDGEHVCTCGKRFTEHSSFREHVRIVHFKDRPFLCHACNHDFSIRGNLKKHIRIHHPEYFPLVMGQKRLPCSPQEQ